MSCEVRKFDLYDYSDVYGTQEDGWEINNLSCIEKGINISDDATDDEIIDYMIKIGWLDEDARDKVYIIDQGELLEFNVKENDMPLGRLSMIG